MERFIFKTGLEAEKVFESNDNKAIGAWVVAEELAQDTNKHMAVIMIISFDLNTSGVSFYEMAQFLYDNYTNMQLVGLHKALVGGEGVTTKEVKYETEEELAALKKEAEELQNKMIKG